MEIVIKAAEIGTFIVLAFGPIAGFIGLLMILNAKLEEKKQEKKNEHELRVEWLKNNKSSDKPHNINNFMLGKTDEPSNDNKN